jgi:hypothetical protein
MLTALDEHYVHLLHKAGSGLFGTIASHSTSLVMSSATLLSRTRNGEEISKVNNIRGTLHVWSKPNKFSIQYVQGRHKQQQSYASCFSAYCDWPVLRVEQ